MAKLRKYKRSSSNSGYHLKGWTKESGNTTLQVRYPCELLFDWLGFEEGERIPSDLIVSLISADLLYTIGDGTDEVQNSDWTPSMDLISEELSASQRQRLLGFVRDYDGPRSKFVERLCSDIDTGESIPSGSQLSSNTSTSQNWQACVDSDSRGADQTLHQIAEDVFGSEPLSDKAASALNRWDVENLDEFGGIPHVESSVLMFRDYPGMVHKVKPGDGYIQYVVSLPEISSEKSWPKPDGVDIDKSWPRFIVTHSAPTEEDVDQSIKIDIPVGNDGSLSAKTDFDGILHKFIVVNRGVLYWLLKPEEESHERFDDWRVELSDHLDVVFEQTNLLMEYLTGDPMADDMEEFVIDFGEMSW